LRPPKEFTEQTTTPLITRDQHSKHRVNHKPYDMNQNTKAKARNKRFNKVRQLVYILGAEWRRFYSNK